VFTPNDLVTYQSITSSTLSRAVNKRLSTR
jgi:hypothetical protein